jgi:hypothetical protein
VSDSYEHVLPDPSVELVHSGLVNAARNPWNLAALAAKVVLSEKLLNKDAVEAELSADRVDPFGQEAEVVGVPGGSGRDLRAAFDLTSEREGVGQKMHSRKVPSGSKNPFERVGSLSSQEVAGRVPLCCRGSVSW